MSIDLDALEKLNTARTPGEWESDGDETEGGWGRYNAYVIRTDKGRIADCVNADYQVSEIHEEGDEDGVHRWDEIGRRNFEFIAAAANSMSELIRLARIGAREEANWQAIDGLGGGRRDPDGKRGISLREAVRPEVAAVWERFWPTPTASRRSGLQSHGKNAILGNLNPTWIEWLQGLPSQWTALKLSEIATRRSSRKQSRAQS